MKEAKVATKVQWEHAGDGIIVMGKTQIASVLPVNRERNVALICCAPEMLAMLKAVKEALESLDGTEYGFPGIDKLLGECCCVIDKVQEKG